MSDRKPDTRKPMKLEDVEWDGLLYDLVRLLNYVLPMERILNSRWFMRLAGFVNRHNMCHADEDSRAWRVACYLFPGCWCCAGIRGFIYGVMVSGLVGIILWVV